MKGIVYYTDSRLQEPIASCVRNVLAATGLPIVSVSLEPLDFGQNAQLARSSGVVTMLEQVCAGLEVSTAAVVFLCEHDVLYHPSHFAFIPTADLFYYNTHVWRWKYPDNLLITYDDLRSQSGLCGRREFLLQHYRERLQEIRRRGWDKDPNREPKWARRIGYELGTRPPRRRICPEGGCETWRSAFPNIDIRHGRTLTRTKCRLVDFIHPPQNWQERQLWQIAGWNLSAGLNDLHSCSQ